MVSSKTVVAQDDDIHYEKDQLLSELDSLRKKVRLLEADNNHLRAEISDRKRIEEENDITRDQLNIALRELAALRSYVYNSTDEEVPDDTSIDEMKNAIKGLNLIVIGGHSKWVSKMKKEFPAWKYISPDASGV